MKVSLIAVAALAIICLSLVGCGGASIKYPVGEIYKPAADHSSWAKQNQQPRQSGAHNRWITIYANESANQVKQHSGSYQPGATILKETFVDKNSMAVEQMFIMEKGASGSAPRSNDWIWIVTDKDGKITATGEDATLNGRRCAICHAGS
jgi:hypothetical protein